jgi:cell shape-determining protein MreC
MAITASDVFTFLSILAVIMTVVALYHLLFILVDLRKITRRFEDVTQQVEALILKPISVADQILEWVMEQMEHRRNHSKKNGVHEKKD